MKLLVLLLFLCCCTKSMAQNSSLSVQKIMQDPKKWIGAQPHSPVWEEQGERIFFQWNPKGQFLSDSLFRVQRDGQLLQQIPLNEQLNVRATFSSWYGETASYNQGFTEKVFSYSGDLFLWQKSGIKRLTRTATQEVNPFFASDNQSIYYQQGINFYQLKFGEGLQIIQLTDIRNEETPLPPSTPSAQQTFLNEQQLALFEVIRTRNEMDEARKDAQSRINSKRLSPFYTQKLRVDNLRLSPNGRFVSMNLVKDAKNKETIVPDYLNKDGYTTPISARPKVGEQPNSYQFHLIDLERDSTFTIDFSKLPNFQAVPQYLKEQGIDSLSTTYSRQAIPHGPYWSYDGKFAVMVIRTSDNKDRWIIRLDPENGRITTLDHQHDEAWIAGPGIDWNGSAGKVGWLPDHQRFYFQSEKSGFSHLYTANVQTGEIKQLTSGEFEVFSPQISKDGQYFYFTSSEGSPFERHFFRMSVNGGTRTKLTTLVGNNSVALSPDEKQLAILYSYSNQPPELYLQQIGQSPIKITDSPTEEWKSYAWRDPEIVQLMASDGVKVPMRVYTPENPNGAAVIFVHGAGYLQNVHRWWSQYFREYMFHNLLADLGYVVLDVDYRASSGYGRDFRTATYRYMGGRDLQDFVDASKYIQSTYQIPPEKIGIYGGSYGGFITLMALFTEGQHFGAGAALRSVTDWAHYNHGYTANILNTPVTDSLAITRSSPIYFAEGLADPLLICHGVVDTNVQVQDVMRLAQRLIELGKDDWELALYPVEDHGFVEPSSWTDEYKRILKLFEAMRLKQDND